MWALKTKRTEALTRQLATYFAEMERAPNDRDVSERRMAEYRHQVVAGQWRSCAWAEAFCVETGTRYRVNGKHTSMLFSRIEVIPPNLSVDVETYECSTLADVARLYATFDRGIQSRNAADINRAYAATVPELARLPKRLINAVAAGIQLFRRGGVTGGSWGLDPASRAEGLIEEATFVLWVSALLTDSQKYHSLIRAGVLAAMFATYRKCQRDALEFWSAVRDETGASPTCPDRQLARWLLLTNAHAAPGGNTPISRRADAREFYVRALHCWNAWRRKVELKIVKYHVTAKVPPVV